MEKRDQKTKFRHVLTEALIVVSVLTTGLITAGTARAETMASQPSSSVQIESEIRVERLELGADGAEQTVLHDPAAVKVVPGDRLQFSNRFENRSAQPVSGFVINNPVHSAVRFLAADEEWAQFSVDGGKTYGKLSDLTVAPVEAGADQRAAVPEDVTHVRWQFSEALAPGANGTVRFYGAVR